MSDKKYDLLYNDIMKNISDLPDIADIECQDGVAVGKRRGNWFMRLIKYLIPWKGDKPAEVIRKIIFFAALVVFVSMLCIIIPYYIEPFLNAGLTDDLRNKYHKTDGGYSSSVMNPKFADLYAENPDIAGWITIDGTNIDYPVVHTDKMKGNQDYYLRTDFNGNYSRYGTIYADKSNNLGYMTESKNITLYGHNMKDDSTMFGQLLHYQELEFYKSHPVFTFDTLYRDGTWKVFAVIITNSVAEDNNGYVFDYRKTDFTSDEQFLYWVNECKKRSIINTGVQVDKTDEILTLQTCTYEFDNARFVVIARRVRSGESKTVNVSAAVKNPDPIYPQAWYDYLGTNNPHANEHPDIVAVTTRASANSSTTAATYPSATTAANRTVSRRTQSSYNNRDNDAQSAGTTAKPTSPATTSPPPATTAAPTSAPTSAPTESQPSEPEPVDTEPSAEPVTDNSNQSE